jgi:hypothetical protein
MRPTPIQPIFCAVFDITKLSRLNFCRDSSGLHGPRFSRSAAKSPEA